MKSLFVVFVSVLFSGCATYRMSVNSLARSSQPTEARYFLMAEKEAMPINQMEAEELEGFIHQSLQKYGYERTADSEEADVFVVYRIKVGSIVQNPYSFSLPIYGQTGGGSASYSAVSSGKYGNAVTVGQVNQAPSYGIVGNQSFSGVEATLPFYFSLQAWDIVPLKNQTGDPVQIWDVTVSHPSKDGDLRKAFPYLVTGAARFFGKDSKKKRRTDVTSVDEDFNKIYKGR